MEKQITVYIKKKRLHESDFTDLFINANTYWRPKLREYKLRHFAWYIYLYSFEPMVTVKSCPL